MFNFNKSRLCICCILRVLILFVGMSSYAMAIFAEEDSVERENKIKIAYLYRFTQFTEWVVQPSVFRYCVYGDEDFSAALKESYRDKTLGTSLIEVQSIDDQSNLNGCQLVYFPHTTPLNVLTKIHQKPILSVSTQKPLAPLGTIIYLFDDNQKIRFFIDNAEAIRVGLKISSQLLALSKQPTP